MAGQHAAKPRRTLLGRLTRVSTRASVAEEEETAGAEAPPGSPHAAAAEVAPASAECIGDGAEAEMAGAAEKAEAEEVEEAEEARDAAGVSSGTNQPDGGGRVGRAAKLVPGTMAVRLREGCPWVAPC